jgi:hypothetical protein
LYVKPIEFITLRNSCFAFKVATFQFQHMTVRDLAVFPVREPRNKTTIALIGGGFPVLPLPIIWQGERGATSAN